MSYNCRNGRFSCDFACAETAFTGDNHKASAYGHNHYGLNYPVQLNAFGKFVKGVLVKVFARLLEVGVYVRQRDCHNGVV